VLCGGWFRCPEGCQQHTSVVDGIVDNGLPSDLWMKKIAADRWSEFDSLFRGSPLSYLAGMFIFAHYLELSLRMPVLEAIRFHFLFGAILTAVSLPKVFKNRLSDPRSKALLRTTYFMVFIFGIYTVFSMDRSLSVTVYFDRFIKFAMIPIFIYAATEKVDDLRIIILIAVLAWLKMGLEGFLGWLTGSLVWENQGIPRLHGASPAVGHPNSFSGFGVGCLPFCVYLIPAVKNRLAKALLLVLLIFSILIIINTGSRTGYVGVLVGAIFYFYKIRVNFFKKIMLVLFLAVATASFLPPVYQERFESIFTGEEKEGHSSERRKEIIDDAIEVVKEYPLGIGVAAFPTVRMEMFGRSQNTHNLYLEILTNTGPLGLVIFLLFLKRLVGVNLANIRAAASLSNAGTPTDWELAFLTQLAKATIGFVVVRLVLGLFGMDMYEIYWWFALGLTLAINKLILLRRNGIAI
jgi:O-antigen ligase